MGNPKISILAPSFNHEKFVGFFIESVLAQTFGDFECIIVDDCSTDRNVEEILKYKDSRIKLVQHSYNQGINASLNTAFEKASAEYLVFCATDDMLESNALEVLYNALEQNSNAKAVYPALQPIDKDNKKYGDIVRSLSMERWEMLHYLFMFKNALTSPGMSLKKSVFKEILYPLNQSMCNLQDMQMHIKLLLKGHIVLLDDILILYRRDSSTPSISTDSQSTLQRENMETHKMLDTFLEIKHIADGEEMLKRIFQKEIKTQNITPHLESIEYFLGRMAILSDDGLRYYWGYNQIMKSYDTQIKAQNLFETYGFTFKDYLQLASQCKQDKTKRKLKKYRKAFKISCYANIVFAAIIGFILWLKI